MRDASADDVEFDLKHPRCATHVQRLARTLSQVATFTFHGQLTEEILLGLFVPWENLFALFLRYATKRDACAHVWKAIEPTLLLHNQAFARNVELLRKFKEDCQADAKLWKLTSHASDLYVHDIDKFEPADFGSHGADSEELIPLQDETFNAQTLIAAFHSIVRSWDREIHARHRKTYSYNSPANNPLSQSAAQNLRSLNICNTPV
ncbi:hypothetical protein BDV40DRAFT_306571 [Aspergillus tamarii]|uniref:Uncharacterized protein n=1 Tax=Aspergillus tamarii TaxID=41984 RepID=A0A5N6UBG0_ASPTM|nr:hypothetical protein BDV40DRAFT_306571 [Aspergillus tamarii]